MKLMESYEDQLSLQVEQRRLAVDLIKLVSDLWYDNNIELYIFRNQLLDRNVGEILKLMEYAREFVQKPLSFSELVTIAKKVQQMNLPPAKLDLGKLAYVFKLTGETDIDAFVEKKLSGAYETNGFEPKDVVLYGFGRIGRLLARELMSKTGKGVQMRLRAIVTRGEVNEASLEKRASLLRKDSVHGYFKGSVKADVKNKALIINGTTCTVESTNLATGESGFPPQGEGIVSAVRVRVGPGRGPGGRPAARLVRELRRAPADAGGARAGDGAEPVRQRRAGGQAPADGERGGGVVQARDRPGRVARRDGRLAGGVLDGGGGDDEAHGFTGASGAESEDPLGWLTGRVDYTCGGRRGVPPQDNLQGGRPPTRRVGGSAFEEPLDPAFGPDR